MYNPIDVYIAFQRARGRPYRMPKDWDAHFTGKMSRQNREALKTVTDFFNTKWNNINVDRYMQIGFEVFPNFTYTKFFDPRVINMYITKDKNEKREMNVDKQKIVTSAKFVKEYIKKNGLMTLKNYARKRNGFESIAVKHYNDNRIDAIFFYYLIYKKLLLLEDEDKSQIGYIIENLRTLKMKVLSILKFLENVEGALHECQTGFKTIDVDGQSISIKSSIWYTDIRRKIGRGEKV